MKIRKKPSTFQTTLFIQQLNSLLTAGMPLITSCNILAVSEKQPLIKQIIFRIKANLLSGKTLAQSIQLENDCFDAFTCQLIEIGEVTGKLETMLTLIVHHKEQQLNFVRKLKNILFYPLIIVSSAFVVMISLFIFIIPRFADLFAETHTPLPLITLLIFHFTTALQQYWFYGILIIFLILAACKYYQPITFSQRIKNFLFQQEILRKILLARLARNLAIAVAAGVTIPKALQLIANTTTHTPFANLLHQQRRYILSGLQIHQAMSTNNYFPNLMLQMIKIGEESGSLDVMLNKLAVIYEDEVERFLLRYSQLLEPLIMVVLGVLIGGLVIGIYLPIFNLGSTL